MSQFEKSAIRGTSVHYGARVTENSNGGNVGNVVEKKAAYYFTAGSMIGNMPLGLEGLLRKGAVLTSAILVVSEDFGALSTVNLSLNKASDDTVSVANGVAAAAPLSAVGVQNIDISKLVTEDAVISGDVADNTYTQGKATLIVNYIELAPLV
jgi:hypothetical protein